MAKKTKPDDCTCRYPEVTLRNISGHDPSCPCHRRNMLPDGLTNAGLTEAYVTVIARIGDGSVNISDFNNLIEALAKSTKERVDRHVRVPKVGPRGQSITGRIVPKRKGRDDPPRQGRGKRYASGRPARQRQNEKSSDSWEKYNAAEISTESILLRPVLTEEQVLVLKKIMKQDDWRCPHCRAPITERFSLYSDGSKWYHRPCRARGPIELPPINWSKISPEWRESLRATRDG